MKVTFGNLIETVEPLIVKGVPSLEELKKYLRRCFQELKPQLSSAESFDDVMELIEDKCTIINICCLEAIVDHYNITEAKRHIIEFKTTVDMFCEKVKTDVCINQNFKVTSSHHLTCETIEFVLQWKQMNILSIILKICYQKHSKIWQSQFKLELLKKTTPSLLPAMLHIM